MEHNKRIIKPSEMRNAGTTVAEQAQINAKQIYQMVTNVGGRKCYSCDDMEIMGKYSLPQGEIFLSLDNQTGNFLQIPLGSPLQVSDEAIWIPRILDTIPLANRWDTDLPNLIDQQCANATF